MTELSKQANGENIENEKYNLSSTDDSVFSLIYTAIKKIAVVGTIYFVGYMGWSVAWLITPVIFAVAREKWRQSTALKRNIAKASALANEKDVILARINDLPAWVYFPDVERCEWVNKILKQVWPKANHYAREILKETIEPNVAAALSKYKLNGFKFNRMILGTIPPRFGGVKIYDKNISRNEIIMDLDLFYASDCDINFVLSGIRGGIKDFQIHGMLRIIMKPLITKIPLIGGLQVFFLNNPNIDFNLVGVADLLDMPGLSDILRRVIVEQISAIMVLPNKLPIILNDNIEALELKMPEPEGVLRIHVIEAKDLMKKDIGVLGKGKSDPYAVITVGAQEFRTQIIQSTVNPKWDYWCEAAVHFESGQFIDIHLFDSDDASNDENLGRATVEISNVVQKGLQDAWLVLEDAKHGMVHVRLTWFNLSSDADDLQSALEEVRLLGVTMMSSAILIVFIDSAKNLPQARFQSKPDPYVVLKVGNATEQTNVQMRTDTPVWEQGYTFLVSNPINDTLQIKIIDQRTGNEIGRYVYILSALLTKKDLQISSQPFQLQKSGPESKLNMSLVLRVLKKSDYIDDDTVSIASSQKLLARTNSTGSSVSVVKQHAKLAKSISEEIDSIEEKEIIASTINLDTSTPSTGISQSICTDNMQITHRIPDTTTSAGDAGLGRIQLTLRYNVQRQKLFITVHKIMNIPLKDPSNIPDPYVKLYLLPSRSKDSKRKTHVVKDNCNPVYDTVFEYIISSSELVISELEVTVCTQKGFLYGGSPVIGMLKIPLNDFNICDDGCTTWFDLQQEIKNE